MMKYITNFLEQFYELFKSNSIICLTIIGSFLLPIRPLLVIVGLMIIIDTVTGIYRSKKLKQRISSRGFSQIVSKMLLYQLSIITFYILDVYIFQEFTHYFIQVDYLFTKIVAMILTSIEIKSISENIYQVTGVSLFSEFKKLLSRGKYLKDSLEDFNSKEKEVL